MADTAVLLDTFGGTPGTSADGHVPDTAPMGIAWAGAAGQPMYFLADGVAVPSFNFIGNLIVEHVPLTETMPGIVYGEIDFTFGEPDDGLENSTESNLLFIVRVLDVGGNFIPVPLFQMYWHTGGDEATIDLGGTPYSLPFTALEGFGFRFEADFDALEARLYVDGDLLGSYPLDSLDPEAPPIGPITGGIEMFSTEYKDLADTPLTVSRAELGWAPPGPSGPPFWVARRATREVV